MSFDFKDISRSRKLLLGIATLWVALYHSGIRFTAKDGQGLTHFLYLIYYQLYLIKSSGQIGVEIFLILSAIGLYYSLEKDDNVLLFYKRRIRRILPTYLLVNIIWGVINSYSFSRILKSVSGILFVCEGIRENWFFILIFFLYLIYPLIYKMQKRHGDRCIILLILLSILANLLLRSVSPLFFEHTEIALRRIPAFLFGAYLAKHVKQGKKANAYIVASVSLLAFLLTYRFISADGSEGSIAYRYFCLVIAAALIFLVGFLYSILSKSRIIMPFIEKNGEYSMEFYLLYEKFVKAAGLFVENGILIAIIAYLLTCLCSFALKKTDKFFFA
ncbi:MAG: acyltransferase [Erysipelotrichaceae bacterium]|nr:acyltransferase [Erysipelotrichaceae bacterium]